MNELIASKYLLAIFSAAIGFLLSQSVNVLTYARRPKFRISQVGVISSSSGKASDAAKAEPAMVALGFYLENRGYTPIENLRIFLKPVGFRGRLTSFAGRKFETNLRLDRDLIDIPTISIILPSRVVPPRSGFYITLGYVSSNNHCFRPNSEDPHLDDRPFADDITNRVMLHSDSAGMYYAELDIFCYDASTKASIKQTMQFNLDETNRVMPSKSYYEVLTCPTE